MYVAVKILKFPKILIRFNMTTEQRQQISEQAEQASAANDIKTLIRLKKIVDKDIRESEFKTPEGNEWFVSSLTGDQIDAIYKHKR